MTPFDFEVAKAYRVVLSSRGAFIRIIYFTLLNQQCTILRLILNKHVTSVATICYNKYTTFNKHRNAPRPRGALEEIHPKLYTSMNTFIHQYHCIIQAYLYIPEKEFELIDYC